MAKLRSNKEVEAILDQWIVWAQKGLERLSGEDAEVIGKIVENEEIIKHVRMDSNMPFKRPPEEGPSSKRMLYRLSVKTLSISKVLNRIGQIRRL